MKKIIFIVLTITMLTAGVFTHETYAEQLNVTVKLPEFPVTLNGITIDNKNIQYPFITYKDITYFPMTYYDCRFLGVESIWNERAGLTVASSGINWNYHKYEAETPNYNTSTARTAPFKITINGKIIDNSKEKYPLLLFRSITYFPLTWRFAVGEFGWNYSFDDKNGLSINSTKSGAAAGQLMLPIVTRESGEKGAFTMAGDYFYYEGENGAIYQALASSPDNKKKVYQLPEADSDGSKYVYAYLKTENGKAVLSYHTGGVTTGSDKLILLKKDGTSEELDSAYSVMKIYDDYQVRADQKRKSGESRYRSAVSPDYLYGWIQTYHNGTKYKSGDIYIGKKEPVNPGGRLKSLEIQNGYMVAVFDKESTSQYKMMIFDDTGELIYKTIENVLLVRIENGKVVYVKDN